jgi:hypothetical protein
MTIRNNQLETVDETSFLARWPKSREIETPSTASEGAELMTAEEIARTLEGMKRLQRPDADCDLYEVTENYIKQRKARENWKACNTISHQPAAGN